MKINWFWVLFTLLMFGVGIIFGIQIGTYAIIDHVTQGLAGSTFIVNFNETKLVEEMNKTIFPRIENIMRGEIHK